MIFTGEGRRRTLYITHIRFGKLKSPNLSRLFLEVQLLSFYVS